MGLLYGVFKGYFRVHFFLFFGVITGYLRVILGVISFYFLGLLRGI